MTDRFSLLSGSREKSPARMAGARPATTGAQIERIRALEVARQAEMNAFLESGAKDAAEMARLVKLYEETIATTKAQGAAELAQARAEVESRIAAAVAPLQAQIATAAAQLEAERGARTADQSTFRESQAAFEQKIAEANGRALDAADMRERESRTRVAVEATLVSEREARAQEAGRALKEVRAKVPLKYSVQIQRDELGRMRGFDLVPELKEEPK